MEQLKMVGVGLALIGLAGAGMVYGFGGEEQADDHGRHQIRRAQFQGLAGSHIGVSVSDVEEADARRGAIIMDVREDTPAAEAGFLDGDVVIEFDGESVRSARQFSRLVGETPADRTVSAVVLRDGERVELEVAPAAGPLSQLRERLGREIERVRIPDMIPEFDVDIRMRPGRLGATVTTLNPQLADYFGVQEGVLVSSVRDGSPAAAAGLQAGDVITAVDGEAVKSSSQLRRGLARTEDGNPVELGITRDREATTLEVTLEGRTTRSRGSRI